VNEFRVSVVVSARDAASTIGDTLDGLAAQEDAGDFEVIVVDNGSNDATAEIVEKHPSAPKLLRRKRGDGPGIARNEGAAAAVGDVLAFTDADCKPTPHWVAAGARAIRDADIVQGAVMPVPGEDIGPYSRTLAVVSEYGLYETANLFVRRPWFERVGGFSDWVGFSEEGWERRVKVPDRPFGEDAWFAWRARRLGARTTFSSDALVHHAVFAGGVKSFVAEQARLRHFPALVAKIPELRNVLAWRRYFLNARTAAFDLGVASLVAAAAVRSPFPIVAVTPYLFALSREVARWRLPLSREIAHAAAVVAADAVGFVALVRGSIEARAPLL